MNMNEKIETNYNDKFTPALIYRQLSEFIDNNIKSAKLKQNLELIIDYHWFFIHSNHHKRQYNCKNHIGKWKYYAISNQDLLTNVTKILPLIAQGKLPVAKFTNISNVFTDEKTIVVYCFPFQSDPLEIKNYLTKNGLKDIFWGSKKFKAP